MALTEHDLRALALAAEVAKSGEYKQRHGAVLYKRGHIISIGYNQKKTPPRAMRFYDYPYLHAEAVCIVRSLDVDIHNATLACVRLNRQGDIMHSRPCEGCISMMKEYGITTIVYSSKTGIEKETI